MSWTRLSIPLLLLSSLAACSSGRVVVHSGGSAPEPVHHGSTSPVHPVKGPVATLGVPPGHFPPPGQCRIWMPGVAPGQQAKCVPCTAIDGEIPPGAWVLYRPSREKNLVRVTTYDRHSPRSVLSVGWYDAATGELLAAADGSDDEPAGKGSEHGNGKDNGKHKGQGGDKGKDNGKHEDLGSDPGSAGAENPGKSLSDPRGNSIAGSDSSSAGDTGGTSLSDGSASGSDGESDGSVDAGSDDSGKGKSLGDKKTPGGDKKDKHVKEKGGTSLGGGSAS